MFKIESITVNNFKNIVDTELPLGDFNVVVGPNNSGKSNFLQVIPFLRWLINGDIKEVEEQLKDGFSPGFTNFFKNENNKNNLHLKLDYSDTKTNNVFSYEIQLSSNNKTAHVANLRIISESLRYKNKSSRGKAIRIFEQKNYSVEFGKEFFSTKLIEQVSPHVSVLRHLNLISDAQTAPADYKEAITGLDRILNSTIFFFSSSELRKELFDKPQTTLRFRAIYTDLTSNIIALKKLSIWKLFISIVNQIIKITDILIPGEKKMNINANAVFLEQNGTYKTIDELSDGSLMILSLITEVLTTKSPLILIEEPENSLHPKALTELILFLQSRTDKQFILTTHSPALLNLVKPEEVIVARLDEKGNSRLEKIKDTKELKRKLNKGYVTFGDLLIDNIDEGEDGEDKEY